MFVLRGSLRYDQRKAGDSQSVSMSTKFVVIVIEFASLEFREETLVG